MAGRKEGRKEGRKGSGGFERVREGSGRFGRAGIGSGGFGKVWEVGLGRGGNHRSRALQLSRIVARVHHCSNIW